MTGVELGGDAFERISPEKMKHAFSHYRLAPTAFGRWEIGLEQRRGE